MTKLRTSLMLIALSVTLVTSLSFGVLQESEAAKGQGVALPAIGSDKVWEINCVLNLLQIILLQKKLQFKPHLKLVNVKAMKVKYAPITLLQTK